MSICYLTGNEIKEKTLETSDDAESLEHIIPNALGGRLSSRRILTHKANQDLNSDIDVPFMKIFESFMARLNLKKDRKTTASTSALHIDSSKEVVVKDGRFFPRKPFYDKNKKTIYADSKKTGENYRKHLLKEKIITEEDVVAIFDDLAGEFSIDFKLDNRSFKRGLAKIAAGYAAFHGVSRENLKGVVDTEQKKFREQIVVAPSIPSSPQEIIFEEASYLSDFYPIHSLVLCGNKSEKILYCYVELFSAFKWYVALDSQYEGEDMHEIYIYDVLGGREIDYKTYATSISKDFDFKKLESEYRVTPIGIFSSFLDVDKLKALNHQRFNMLSAFVNHTYLAEKAKGLGLSF